MVGSTLPPSPSLPAELSLYGAPVVHSLIVSACSHPDPAIRNDDLRTLQNGVISFSTDELAEFNGRTTGAGYVLESAREAHEEILTIAEPHVFADASRHVPDGRTGVRSLSHRDGQDVAGPRDRERSEPARGGPPRQNTRRGGEFAAVIGAAHGIALRLPRHDGPGMRTGGVVGHVGVTAHAHHQGGSGATE